MFYLDQRFLYVEVLTAVNLDKLVKFNRIQFLILLIHKHTMDIVRQNHTHSIHSSIHPHYIPSSTHPQDMSSARKGEIILP
uniref:Uncharacterized protein n=1 Tax=Hordeum vulgare subsp. vulgare TaxID=112509 RepID=A0A8I6XEB4_HORVV